MLIDILRSCAKKGNTLEIPNLDRAQYQAIKPYLTLMGCVWDRKKATHIFQNGTEMFDIVCASGILPELNPFAYYPTPKPVVDRLWAYVSDCYDTMLEPSAGSGAIALEGIQRGLQVDCIEIDPINVARLKKIGLNVIHQGDCLTYRPNKRYDIAVMNPPFTIDGDRHHYMKHILYALSCVDYVVLSIVPAGFITDHSKKMMYYKSILYQHSVYYEELPAKTFKSAGTSIATGILEIKKRSTNYDIQPYNGWSSYNVWLIKLYIGSYEHLYREYLKLIQRNATFTEFENFYHAVERFAESKNDCIFLRDVDILELFNEVKYETC